MCTVDGPFVDRSEDLSLLTALRVLHVSHHFIVVDKDWDVRINATPPGTRVGRPSPASSALLFTMMLRW